MTSSFTSRHKSCCGRNTPTTVSSTEENTFGKVQSLATNQTSSLRCCLSFLRTIYHIRTMGPIDPLPLIGTRLVCLGELLHIVGLITPNWLEATEGDEHVGLFNYCCGEGVCTVIYDPPITLKVTIVMTLLGTLCGQAGTAIAIFFIVSIYTSKPPHILVAVGGFLACIGAFNYTTIGVCVFGAKIYGEGLLIDTTSDVEFGFSFALCIVGAILMQTGGALAYLNVSRSKVVEKTLCPIA